MPNKEAGHDRRHFHPLPNGFPSTKFEQAMKINFLDNTGAELSEFLRLQVPDWKPTSHQIRNLLAILYGIYFYDHVTGGAILSGLTSCNDAANRFRVEHLSHQPPLTHDDLPLPSGLIHWPLLLDYGHGAVGCYRHGIVKIPIGGIPDRDPYQTRSYYAPPPVYKPILNLITNKSDLEFSPYVLQCLSLNRSLLTGIEEAQHSHFCYLERTHYSANGNDDDYPKGPLRSFRSRWLVKLTMSLDGSGSLNYDSLLGDEFAAHIVQAEYVRRYLPVYWKRGYQKYDILIRARRRQARKKS